MSSSEVPKKKPTSRTPGKKPGSSIKGSSDKKEGSSDVKPKKSVQFSTRNKPVSGAPSSPSVKVAENDLTFASKPKRPKKTVYYYDEEMTHYKCRWDENYGEKPERISKPNQLCKQQDLLSRCTRPPIKEARLEDFLSIHTEEYVKKVKSTENMNEDELNTLEHSYDGVFFHQNSWKCSKLSLGATIQLTDKVVEDKANNGIAVIRPPGHHAMRDEANGYCYFNNVAICAKRALDKHGLNRVLIVDYDVHHGQGLQRIFYDDPRVMYITIHRYEHGWYWPNLAEGNWSYIGKDEGRGYNINIPLNTTGMTDSDYLAIFHNVIIPLARQFDPELVLVASGFDAAMGDPEGMMEITPAAYGHFIHMLRSVADGRIAVILEGGYCIPALSHAVTYVMKALLGDPLVQLESTIPAKDELLIVLLKLIHSLSPYWSCFNGYDSDLLSTAINIPTQDPRGPAVYETEGLAYYETYVENGECDHYQSQDEETRKMWREKIKDTVSKQVTRRTKHRSCYHYDEAMLKHRNIMDATHPERPERISRIRSKLEEYGLLEKCVKVPTRRATTDELKLCHSLKYIQEVKEFETTPPRKFVELEERYNSIYLHKETYSSALAAAGGLLNVVDNVMTEQSQNGFAIIRPPGHHAEEDTACGFCFFNSVPIAAKYAQTKHNAKRVAIVDWDIHHGNGVQKLFYSDPSILYISLHRYDDGGFFPASPIANYNQVGDGPGEGYNINIPFNIRWNDSTRCRNPGDPEYIEAFTRIILPVLYEFAPDLILVSAGFDAARHDPLGGYKITPAGYSQLTHMLSSVAGGRLILALEGGYNLDSISESYSSCVDVMLGAAPARIPYVECDWSARETIDNVIKTQKKYWECLRMNDIPKSLVDKVVIKPKPATDDEVMKKLEQQLKKTVISAAEEEITANSTEPEQPAEQPTEIKTESIEEAAVSGAAATASSKDPDEDEIQMFAVIPLAWCAHLEDNQPLLGELNVKAQCEDCGNVGENWVCLTCYKVFCSRFVNEHALFHAMETEHRMVLSYSDLSVWCYACDAYVHNEDLLPMKNAAHKSKFGQPMPEVTRYQSNQQDR